MDKRDFFILCLFFIQMLDIIFILQTREGTLRTLEQLIS